MKRIPNLSSIFLIGISLFSCMDLIDKRKENLSLEKDFKSIEINSEYTMSVPKYMKETNGLNDDASLQYQNIFKETYVVVIDEPKEEFVSIFRELGEYNDSLSVIENYRDIQLQFLSEGITIDQSSESEMLKIKDLNAELVTITGKVTGVIYGISYTLAFIEGSEDVYMIMAWTLESRQNKYEKTFMQMIKSFRLLKS